jgi:alpha-N-arabinofuranosidase
MQIANPVIPGFYPDPSVCVVGEDLYLVTSSFEYFPGVPIFHSRDAIHWRQIGHCLTRPSQLNLEKIGRSAGIYAPTIRHHAGRFYMITTNVGGGGNFYVTAEDPAGPWSEPIWVDEPVFDPSLLFDDDGSVYYTRRADGGIGQAEIDILTGKLKGEFRLISKGLCSPDAEGPHLYKLNGLYYLMIAEGGTRFGHSETIARSASPWGPFEPCPHNPILTHRHLSGHPIRDTGHAELFQAPDGRWWLVCLGTRHRSYDTHTFLGRETFLAPVTWTDDGWPLVNGDGTIPFAVDAAGVALEPASAETVRDDFDSAELGLPMNFIRNPRSEDWSLRARPGWLRLMGSAVTLDDIDSPAFVGRRQRHFDCRATTLLDFSPNVENEEAGLTVLMDNRHHYDLFVAVRAGVRSVCVRRRIGDLSAIVARADSPDGLVRLEVTSQGAGLYSMRYGGEAGPMTTLAIVEGRYICSELAHTWTGMYFGLYATGNGQRCSKPADFDWLEYEALG